jgi:hypothetical protein
MLPPNASYRKRREAKAKTGVREGYKSDGNVKHIQIYTMANAHDRTRIFILVAIKW